MKAQLDLQLGAVELGPGRWNSSLQGRGKAQSRQKPENLVNIVHTGWRPGVDAPTTWVFRPLAGRRVQETRGLCRVREF